MPAYAPIYYSTHFWAFANKGAASDDDKTTSSSTASDDGFSSPRKHGSLDIDMSDGEKDCVDLTDETIDDGEDPDSRTNCAIEKRNSGANDKAGNTADDGKDDNTPTVQARLGHEGPLHQHARYLLVLYSYLSTVLVLSTEY